MAASQAKRPRGPHEEEAKETKGAAATAQAGGTCFSDVDQAKQARGTVTVPRECVPSDAAGGGSLSRSERVRKKKILADM